LAFGTLYPAYSSYKAVKTKNVKEYVKWMMYWIVFALFTTAETATDLLLSWFPFYFELKIAFVIWLLSPYTKGSSVLYRKFVHPTLSNKEKEIDEYIAQAKDRSYETMMRFGKRGLNLAANAAVTAATKGQGVLSDKLRSFSMQDLTLINADDELALHTSEGRMRRDHMDEMSSGASTLPRAKSTAARQSKSSLHAQPTLPRSLAAASLADDASSQHSSDQSDTRTEHSDEDVGEKALSQTHYRHPLLSAAVSDSPIHPLPRDKLTVSSSCHRWPLGRPGLGRGVSSCPPTQLPQKVDSTEPPACPAMPPSRPTAPCQRKKKSQKMVLKASLCHLCHEAVSLSHQQDRQSHRLSRLGEEDDGRGERGKRVGEGTCGDGDGPTSNRITPPPPPTPQMPVYLFPGSNTCAHGLQQGKAPYVSPPLSVQLTASVMCPPLQCLNMGFLRSKYGHLRHGKRV
ncbi:hypothetical protein L3Q82_020657, partial [Scortum barcoo]